MRPTVIFAVAVLLFLQPAGRSQTDDEARTIIGKAIKAMGLDKEPADSKGYRTKAKGTVEVNGMSLPFSQTTTIRLPDQFKDAMELDVNNMKLLVNTVFDGKKGWVEVSGQIINLDDKVTAELKDIGRLIKIGRLKVLLDKKYELAVIGEVKVDEKPAVGIRVSSKGTKDITLFFEKSTSLLVKVDRQAIDAMSGQEVQEERIIHSYQDKDRGKMPHMISVLRDGKKYVDAEVLELTPLDDVDPSEFDMPK
jgi:hypothetical protein